MSSRKIKNMEEFAAVSGISRPTLSKFFNDPTSVRSSTRKRVEAALDRYDYRPNLYAMNQNRRLTKNIGVVVPHLADPFFAKIARTIEEHILRQGFRPVLLGSHGSPEMELENLENLRMLKPAGVLLAAFGRSSDHAQIQTFTEEVPTVLFDANIEKVGKAFIGSNNEQSVDLIVDYLCRTGEPPAFFEMKDPMNPNAYKRRAAYVRAMERLGQTPHLIQVGGEGWEFEEIGFREGTRVIRDRSLPSKTILCSNDRLAIGVLSAPYELGLRVGHGKDCAMRIAGQDDPPFSRYTCPPLTTIAQDYGAIANRAASTLFRIIESETRLTELEETLFDGKLVMRASA